MVIGWKEKWDNEKQKEESECCYNEDNSKQTTSTIACDVIPQKEKT